MAESPSSISRKLLSRMEVASAIIDGLSGRPFQWGQGEAMNWMPMASQLGVTLRTETAINRMGRQLRRGVRPVGSAYYGAPIQKYCDLYVVECQTKPKSKAAAHAVAT